MRLIDADKLPHKDLSDGKGLCMVVFSQDIAKAPTIDAEQKTGEWLLEEYKSQNHIENFYICSSCRNFEAWGKTELYNYCPNCGAKMRGEDSE